MSLLAGCRFGVRTLALLGVLLTAGWLSAADEKSAPRNVIMIVADDLGFQLGCYGDKVARTPGLDRLAASGTRFTQAYCTTASCSASRSVILTGLHNHATGHYGHAHAEHHFSTYDNVPTLPVLLNEAGYRTAIIGKSHVTPQATYRFGDVLPMQGKGGPRNPVVMAEIARQWIQKAPDKPFFLYFCPTDPHRAGADSFANPEPGEEGYPGIREEQFSPDQMVVPPWLPDNADTRKELAEFYQAACRVDQGVTALLDFLQSSGLEKNTLVLFLSDNGPPFPGAKTTLYQPGMHLPLLVRNPLMEERGQTCEARVTWADLTPTILDYCQVTPAPRPPIVASENGNPPPPARQNRPTQPVRFHGRSFLKAMTEPSPADWDIAFGSHTFHEVTMYYPMRVVIDGEWKLIFNVAHQLPYPFASDLYASPTWQGVLNRNESQFGVRTVEAYLQRPRFELYNLNDDPWEAKNLSADPAHQETLTRLQKKLQQWQKETRDPWELKWRYE